MREERIGFAMCGSFCCHEKALRALEELTQNFSAVVPILSPCAASTDTRFGTAKELLSRVEELTGRTPITTIEEAEPIGPKGLVDALIIAPCTGATLARLAHGLTDTAVAMAAKSHLRNAKPLVIAFSTNDGLSGSAANIASLLTRRNYYFVPFGQDDATAKPTSLAADFTKTLPTVEAALRGEQLQPIII